MPMKELVQALQQTLIARGHSPGAADGDYGPRTHAAVLAALGPVGSRVSADAGAVGSGYRFSAHSRARLDTCDPRLIRVIEAALATSPMDFVVTCGHRNKADQDAAVAAGNSRARWPNSKHNSLPSKAVDIAPYINGAIPWTDGAAFIRLGEHVMATAERLGVPLTWGRYFSGLVDLPHFELRE